MKSHIEYRKDFPLVVIIMLSIPLPGCAMTNSGQNKRTVQTYMNGFRKNDRPQILSCLSDDVEWLIPGAFQTHGKEEFAKHITDAGFIPPPEITVTRMTESDDVVVAEGSVRTKRTDGTTLRLAFCDVFEMDRGKIRKLISYMMETQ